MSEPNRLIAYTACDKLRALGYEWREDTKEWASKVEAPKCCVCGATERLHKDGWYGYRCDSENCIPY